MPPIPIYADAPIAGAVKADGITPQTAPPPTKTSEEPTTTTSSSANGNVSSYPAAQPGAAAVPAPTGSVSKPPQPVAPPPTRTIPSNIETGPPPPQPGAVPQLSSPTAANGYNPGNPASPRALPLPHQLNIPPPPTSNQPTSTASPTSPTHRPVTLPMGTVSPTRARPQSISSHPPGYVQNPYAAEMTSAQRASLEAAEAADRGRISGRNSISEWIAGEGDGFGSPTTGTSRAWDAVKGFANQAGEWAGKANDYATKKFG